MDLIPIEVVEFRNRGQQRLMFWQKNIEPRVQTKYHNVCCCEDRIGIRSCNQTNWQRSFFFFDNRIRNRRFNSNKVTAFVFIRTDLGSTVQSKRWETIVKLAKFAVGVVPRGGAKDTQGQPKHGPDPCWREVSWVEGLKVEHIFREHDSWFTKVSVTYIYKDRRWLVER